MVQPVLGESLDLASDLCLARRSAFTCRINPQHILAQTRVFSTLGQERKVWNLSSSFTAFVQSLCRRNQPSGIARSLWASFMPQQLPKLTARRTVGNGERQQGWRGGWMQIDALSHQSALQIWPSPLPWRPQAPLGSWSLSYTCSITPVCKDLTFLMQ